MRSFAHAPGVKGIDRRVEELPPGTISDARSVGEYRSIRQRHPEAAAGVGAPADPRRGAHFATGGSGPMKISRSGWLGLLAFTVAAALTAMPAAAQQQQRKPNILVIMGDDVGWFNIAAYHRGMMSGKTPNLDKLASEGMLFTDYYAE